MELKTEMVSCQIDWDSPGTQKIRISVFDIIDFDNVVHSNMIIFCEEIEDIGVVPLDVRK